MMTTPARELRLEAVLHAYLQALDRGETPDRQALQEAHPDLRDELAEYFADASRLERMAKSLKTATFAGDAGTVSPSLGKVRYFGDYELLEEIARGGMGVVYRAKQVSLGRLVAVKMILKGELASEADVRRFRLEAEAAANLDHPNIVPIYEIGEHEGQQYFSMKLIETQPLLAGPLDSKLLAACLAKVARAVHHAHQRGILHRDLKPSNILIDKEGEPHVADFGLAKVVSTPDSPQATRSGAIVGTPAYMAPEQARTEKVLTTSVDVYSLGAILYEWLVGRPPFRGDDPLATLLKVIGEEPAPPRSINASVDPDLQTICLKCLEKDPTNRYRSAEALAEDLERWQRGEPIHARPASKRERLVKWVKRRPAIAALIGLLSVTLVGSIVGGIVFTWHLSQARDEAVQARKDADAKALAASKARDQVEATLYVSQIRNAAAEWNSNFIDRAQGILDDCLFSEHRGWEWHYLQRQCNRDLFTCPGMNWTAYSPDGKWLATVARSDRLGGQSAVVVRDAQTFDVRHEFTAENGRTPYRFDFSRDGKVLVVLDSDGGITSWNLVDGRKALHVFDNNHSAPYGYVAVSPKEDLIAILEPGRLRLLEFATGKLVRKIDLQERPLDFEVLRPTVRDVAGVAFNHDGSLLAIGANREVWLFDPQTGKQVHTLPAHEGQVTTLAFSPKGDRLLSGSYDGVLRVAKLTKPTEPVVLKHRHPVNAAQFSPDGKWIATYDGIVRIWDAEKGTVIASFLGHHRLTQWLNALSFHPDGKRLASVGGDDQLKVWDVSAQAPPWPASIDTKDLCDLSYSPDGKFLAICRISIARNGDTTSQTELWDTRTREHKTIGKPVTMKKSETFLQLRRTVFSPDGRQLAMVDFPLNWTPRITEMPIAADVHCWDTESGKWIRTLEKAGEQVAFSGDGQWIATARDPYAAAYRKLLESPPGPQIRVWKANGEHAFDLDNALLVNRIAFSPDGKYLIALNHSVTARKGVSVWHITPEGGRKLHLFGNVGMESLSISADGKYLAVSSTPGDVDVWELPHGKHVAAIREARNEPRRRWSSDKYLLGYNENYLAFSPDGKRLAFATETKLRIWDPHSRQELLIVEKEAERVHRLHFTPDGNRLLLLGDKERWRHFDASPLPKERLYRWAAPQYADRLKQTLRLRSKVIDHLQKTAGLDEEFRALALAHAEKWAIDAIALNDDAWDIARIPELPAAEYEQALEDIQAALQIDANEGSYLNTLGVIQYRLGRYEEALATLSRSYETNIKVLGHAEVSDLAFLAMAHHQLGQATQARQKLEELRALVFRPGSFPDHDNQAFFLEATKLIKGKR